MREIVPLPGQFEEPHLPSTLYIPKEPTWKYKLLQRDVANEEAMTEAELNTLGEQGWELITVVLVDKILFYYLKLASS